MSANTRTLLLAPFDKFLVPYWGIFSRRDVATLSDEGSRSIYVDRFWGQVLRKYFQGTQGRLSFASVVSVPTGNLTVLCLQLNLPVLLREPGQSFLQSVLRL